MLSIILIAVAAIALVVLIGVFAASRFVVIPPNEVGMVSGSAKTGDVKIILPGGRDFVWPILQTIRYLPMTQQTVALGVEAEDKNKIKVFVSAVAAIKVGDNDAAIRAAAQRFMGKAQIEGAIAEATTEALEGTLRSIVGAMTVSDLISDREALQQQVLDGAETVLAGMGLAIDTLQINKIEDNDGYIASLGVPERKRVEQEARIATANAEALAAAAEATSQATVAQQQRDLAIKKAALKKEIDAAQADAGPLAKAENDRKVAEIEQRAAQARADLRERELDTEVRKPADADLYARTRGAEAAKAEQINAAEAAAERKRLDAEAQAGATARLAEAEATATKARALAEAEAVRAAGEAEAEASRAKGLAAAEATKAQAEAMERYGEAAKAKQVIDVLPEIARALAEPMGRIEGMTVVSADGAGKITQMAASVIPQLDGLTQAFLGKPVSDLLGNEGGKGVTRSGDSAH